MAKSPSREQIIQEYYAANQTLLIAEELKDLGYNPEIISPKSIVITSKEEYTHFLEVHIQDICAENSIILEEDCQDLTTEQIKEGISKGHILPIEDRADFLAQNGKYLFIAYNPNSILQEDLDQMLPEFDSNNHIIEINGYEEINRKAENLFLDRKLLLVKSSPPAKAKEEIEIILEFALENMNENPKLIHQAIDSLIKNDPNNTQLKQDISNYLVDYSNKLITIPHAFKQAAELDKLIDHLNAKKTDYAFAKLSRSSKEKLLNLSSLLENKERTSLIIEADISAIDIRKLNKLVQELEKEKIPVKTQLVISGLVAYTNNNYLSKQAELGNIIEINSFAGIAYQSNAFVLYDNYKSENHIKERFARIAASKILNAQSPSATEEFNNFLDQKPQLGDSFSPEHESNLVKKILDSSLTKAETAPDLLNKTVKLIKEQNQHDDGLHPVLKVLLIAKSKFSNNQDLEKIYNQVNIEKLSEFIIKHNLIRDIAKSLGDEKLNRENILAKLYEVAEKGSVVGEVANYLLEQSNASQNPEVRNAINQVIKSQLKDTLSIGSELEINEIYNASIQAGNQELADLIQSSNPDMILQAIEINPTEIVQEISSKQERTDDIKPAKKDKGWTIRGAAHKTVKTFGLSSGSIKDRDPEIKSIMERGAHKASKRFKEYSNKFKNTIISNSLSVELDHSRIAIDEQKSKKAGIIKRGTHKIYKRIKEQGNKIKDNISPNLLLKELDQLEIVAKDKDTPSVLQQTTQEKTKPKLIIHNSMYLTQRYFEEILNISEKHSGIKNINDRKKALDKDIHNFLDNVISSVEQRIKDGESETRKQELNKVKESKSLGEFAKNIINIDLNKVIGTNRSSSRKHNMEVIRAARIFKDQKNIEAVILKAELDVVRKIHQLENITDINKQDEIKKIRENSEFSKKSKEISNYHGRIYKDTFWKKFANFCEIIGASPLANKFEELNIRRKEKLKPKREQVFKAQVINALLKLGIHEKADEVVDSILSKRIADRRTIEERVDGAAHNIIKHTIGSSKSIDPTKEKVTKKIKLINIKTDITAFNGFSDSIAPPLNFFNKSSHTSVKSK